MRKCRQNQEPEASKDEPVVSDVGTGADARKIVRVGSWEFTAWTGKGDDEPRIKDLDEGERLGFERPRDIRKLIERHLSEGNLNNSDVRATVARTRIGVAERDVTEYWLTEAAALFIATKSETPAAVAVTKEMIHVYRLARRGLLPSQQAAGLTREEIAHLVATVATEVVGRVMEPMMRRLSSIEERLERRTAHNPGVITGEQLWYLKLEISMVSGHLRDLGDYQTIQSAKSWIHQQLKAATGWGGCGRQMHEMPSAHYSTAMASLRVLKQQAERRLKKRPAPRNPNGQVDLFDAFKNAHQSKQTN